MIQTTVDIIMQHVKSSLVPESDLALWRDVLDRVSEDVRVSLLNQFSTNPDCIRFFTENIRQKFTTLQSNDEAVWQAILDGERAYLASIDPAFTDTHA